ncbi:MAG: glycosyltransferase [Rhodospirillales bacterium]
MQQPKEDYQLQDFIDGRVEVPAREEKAPAPAKSRQPGISVIVPVYNGARFIAACIESLLAQSCPPQEILIVDDLSDDGTAEIAQKYEKVTVLRLKKRSGAGTARAEGIKVARGELVAFLDADCTAPPAWLETFLKRFEDNPEMVSFGSGYRHRSSIGFFGHVSRIEDEYCCHIAERHAHCTTLLGGNMIARRQVLSLARSGRDQLLFRKIASGEDTIVAHDLRELGPTLFFTGNEVDHAARPGRGYFTRHINRGFSGLTQILHRFERKEGEGGMAQYGGPAFYLGTIILPFALLGLIAAPILGIYAAAGWGVASGIAGLALLAAHFRLTRDFFTFVAASNDRQGPESRLSGFQMVIVRGLMSVRTALWALGCFVALRDLAAEKLRLWGRVIASVAHFWRPGKISRLFFFVTAQCNARCSFCFNLDNVVNWSKRKPVELKLEEIEKLAKSFGRLPYITMSGGEPYVRPDLAEVCEAFYRNAKTQWITIPSNGALTQHVVEKTREILVRCPGMFLTVQMSVDGMAKEHDESRKIKGGFDAMARTLVHLARLRRQHPNLRLQINTCYDDFNKDVFHELIRYCEEHFQVDQQLFYLIRDGEKLITTENNHLAREFLLFLADNEKRTWKDGKKSLWNRAIRALQGLTYADMYRIKVKQEFLRKCFATRKFVTLYDDGKITPCEVLEDVDYGNVRDHDLDIYKLLGQKSVEDYYEDEIVGKKCNCEWQCQIPMNMLYDPRMVGRIARAVVDPDRAVDRFIRRN